MKRNTFMTLSQELKFIFNPGFTPQDIQTLLLDEKADLKNPNHLKTLKAILGNKYAIFGLLQKGYAFEITRTAGKLDPFVSEQRQVLEAANRTLHQLIMNRFAASEKLPELFKRRLEAIQP